MGGFRIRRSSPGARTRWPSTTARAAPVLLEECKMGARAPAHVRGRTRILGNVRISHVRRPMAGTAIQRRLIWRLARLTTRVHETRDVKTLVFDVPGWPGHRAGQHVDVRLTADDGYQAQRSYSIASAP